jgi:peptide/nickel transport system permease protein
VGRLVRFVVARTLKIIPTLLVISFIIFSVTRLIPGDPVAIMFGQEPDPQTESAMRHRLGLDRPVLTQYAVWIRQIFRMDWGKSIRLETPVLPMVIERYPRTLSLAAASLVIATILTLVAGSLSARRPNTWIDTGITIGSLLGISTPSMWFGLLLMILFSVKLGVLPTSGWISPTENFVEYLRHLVMPGLTLGLAVGAVMTRMLRSSLLEVLSQDYVALARAKGASEARVVYMHALKNALIPVVTLAAIQIGYTLGGTVIIERVFTYPGIGHLALDSLFSKDYPVIQAVLLSYAFTFILCNFAADILYGFLDPRVRYG